MTKDETPGPWSLAEGDEAVARPAMQRHGFDFTGTGREYFGIWIVNVMLTILTLGIYSAWAKVRRQRYFYGNTRLAGAGFDYHARPIQILIGRIVVLSVLVVYNLALTFLPVVGGLLVIPFVAALPFFIMRGLRFNARVTTYRNVRFDFSGGYWGAFKAYVLGGVLTWGTLGILAPLASRWMWTYTLGNLSYGGRPVECDPRLERLYGQLWLPVLVLIGGAVLFGAAAAVIAMATAGALGDMLADQAGASMGIFLLLVYASFVPVILLYGLAALLYRAGVRNVAFTETVLDRRHLMDSRIGRWRYAWIAISNLAATILSLGLARPWAAVRMARYLASVTALHSLGPLDAYLSEVKDEGPAVGSEYMDVEGLDFGF